MQTTTHYNLNMPEATDLVQISPISENFDTLDSVIYGVDNKSLSESKYYYIYPEDSEEIDHETRFSSVTEALETLPKNLGGFAVSIQLKTDITENITIDNFTNGTIWIHGNNSHYPEVDYFAINGSVNIYNSNVQLYWLDIKLSGVGSLANVGVNVFNDSNAHSTVAGIPMVRIYDVNIMKEDGVEGGVGIAVSGASFVEVGRIANEVNISGCMIGVRCNGGIAMISNKLTIDGASFGLYCSYTGLMIGEVPTFDNTDTQYIVQGGRVLLGSQTNVPSY